MFTSKQVTLCLCCIFICTGTNTALIAGELYSSIIIGATVSSSCNISTNSMNFSNYDPAGVNASSPLSAVSNLSIRCTKNTVATIAISRGQHANYASTTQRAMKGDKSGDYLDYDLYTNSDNSKSWNESNTVKYLAINSNAADINIYASIPANQDVKDDTYHDTVNVDAIY